MTLGEWNADLPVRKAVARRHLPDLIDLVSVWNQADQKNQVDLCPIKIGAIQ
jgi:hypothetical protein